jgi:flagellar hook-associated protein 1 FlgK
VGTFDSISSALSGLYAQRQGLDVAAQNIANSSTTGYTRQRVAMQSVGTLSVPGQWSTPAGIPGGVEVTGVVRVQDAFVQAQVRDSHAVQAQLTQSAGTMSSIESLFTEPSTSGLSEQLSGLWGAFQDMANQPGDTGVRASLLQKAATVTDWLNNAATSLSSQAAGMTTQIGALVGQVNDTATRLAALNGSIAAVTVSGVAANELSDQRDQLALKLSQLVGGTVVTDDAGNVNVRLGGRELVSGTNVSSLGVTAAGGQTLVQWTADGSTAAIPGGQVKALVDGVDTVVPQWMSRLDQVASALASQVNALHQTGYDLNGAAGTPLFSGTTAATISVAITDPRLVAASSVAPAAGKPSLDAGIANALGRLSLGAGSPDAVYRQMVTDLGQTVQTANDRVTTQDAIAASADAAQQSVSGVSTDEEMTSIVTYQRAYEACSRVLTAVDSTLDTLINHTGLVGRA